jgi:catechol 2,3-dioxygenase-like lactoylglutathione lyase family enzyme
MPSGGDTMKPYDHIAFQVSNMNKSIHFYEEKLGFQFVSRGVDADEQEEFAFLTLGELKLELLQDLSGVQFQKPIIKHPFCPHLAIESQDLEKDIAELKEKGVRIIKGPLTQKDEVSWVYFADLDNNILEYVQWYNKK